MLFGHNSSELILIVQSDQYEIWEYQHTHGSFNVIDSTHRTYQDNEAFYNLLRQDLTHLSGYDCRVILPPDAGMIKQTELESAPDDKQAKMIKYMLDDLFPYDPDSLYTAHDLLTEPDALIGGVKQTVLDPILDIFKSSENFVVSVEFPQLALVNGIVNLNGLPDQPSLYLHRYHDVLVFVGLSSKGLFFQRTSETAPDISSEISTTLEHLRRQTEFPPEHIIPIGVLSDFEVPDTYARKPWSSSVKDDHLIPYGGALPDSDKTILLNLLPTNYQESLYTRKERSTDRLIVALLILILVAGNIGGYLYLEQQIRRTKKTYNGIQSQLRTTSNQLSQPVAFVDENKSLIQDNQTLSKLHAKPVSFTAILQDLAVNGSRKITITSVTTRKLEQSTQESTQDTPEAYSGMFNGDTATNTASNQATANKSEMILNVSGLAHKPAHVNRYLSSLEDAGSFRSVNLLQSKKRTVKDTEQSPSLPYEFTIEITVKT